MDHNTLFLIGIGIVGVLAVLNAWRGAVLSRRGDVLGARKHFVLGASMIMLMAFAVYIRPVG